MSEHAPDGQDPSDDAARKKRSERGAFMAIGVTFFVLGLTQLSGDSAGWGVSYLGVGVVFMSLSGGTRSSRGTGGGSAGGRPSDRPGADGDEGPA